MLRFGGPAMRRRASAQAFDEVLVKVPHQELGFLFHDINDSRHGQGKKKAESVCPQPLALSPQP